MNMMKKLIVTIAIIMLAILAILFFSFKTGNVTLDFQDNNRVGSHIKGDLYLTLQKGDSIQKGTPILIYISKGGKVIEAATLTIDEIVSSSKNPQKTISKDGQEFYEQEGTYTIQLDPLFNYQFEEAGTYIVTLQILSSGYSLQKSFYVNS